MSPLERRFEAVFFDLDDTLLDRVGAFRNWARDYLAKCGDADGLVLENLITELAVFDECGKAKREDFFAQLSDFLNVNINVEESALKWQEDFPRYALLAEGAEAILDELKGKYPLALITNGPSTYAQKRKIEYLGIADYFDVFEFAGELGIAKPDPEIFWKACEKLKIDPRKTMYVGNDFETDIIGAYNAGLVPVWIRVPGCSGSVDPQAALPAKDFQYISEIESLYQLRDLI
jgi:putative hydrolase of the HAD superfamily